MNILVTGGAGYIGSHTCVVLLEAGHRVAVVDDLRNSRPDVPGRIEKTTGREVAFFPVDAACRQDLDPVFRAFSPDAVIHFAGFKSAGESVLRPLDYYENNLGSTLAVVRACVDHGVNALVFSSSAAVYGEREEACLESMGIGQALSPYGAGKQMSERILTDTARAVPGLRVRILRYFNPAGAHPGGLLGEWPERRPDNLLPRILGAADGSMGPLTVYGDDYPTPDGTGVRDLFHVMDLARGHLSALERIGERRPVEVYNLGSGRGVSVLELIRTVEKVTGRKVPVVFGGRRPGDLARCTADPSRARIELGWEARESLDVICRDAWRFVCRSRQGAVAEDPPD